MPLPCREGIFRQAVASTEGLGILLWATGLSVGDCVAQQLGLGRFHPDEGNDWMEPISLGETSWFFNTEDIEAARNFADEREILTPLMDEINVGAVDRCVAMYEDCRQIPPGNISLVEIRTRGVFDADSRRVEFTFELLLRLSGENIAIRFVDVTEEY